MPGIFFTNAWMLAGLTALAAPIIIHLLLRRKKKRVRFSTVQFFLKQDKESSQRRKLRNWLLLALRLLICALLVFAFARPFLRSAATAPLAGQQRQVVVVLDLSLSMQARTAGGIQWERAQQSARQLLSTLKPDDRVALVGCGANAEVLAEWGPPANAVRVLEGLHPAFTSARLADGLRQAKRLFDLGDPHSARSLYIISDLQRNSSANVAEVQLPADPEIKVIGTGDLLTPNMAVTDLRADPANGNGAQATVANFSDTDAAAASVELRIDGQLVATPKVPIPAGSSTNLELLIPPLKPGWHEAALQLKGADALRADDARYECLFVPEPAKALVVESRQGKRVFEEESFFVASALDPVTESTNLVASPFRCVKVSADELATTLLNSKGKPACDLVIVPALKAIPGALANAMKVYVESGGGLLFFAGDDLSPNRYNSEFHELLPARLGPIEQAPDPEWGWRIGLHDTNQAAFSIFTSPDSGDLSLARFSKRVKIADADPKVVLARFEDGTPLQLARAVGAGRVMFVNTSADTRWSDWPKHKTFVPWLHGTAQHLARLHSTPQTESKAPILAGAPTDLDLGSAAAKRKYQITSAGAKPISATADAAGALHDVLFPAPGIFSIRDDAGKEVRRVAVNPPQEESDLSALSSTEFQRKLVRAPENRPAQFAAGLLGGGGNQKELWRVLLMSVLALLLIEMLLANRTPA